MSRTYRKGRLHDLDENTPSSWKIIGGHYSNDVGKPSRQHPNGYDDVVEMNGRKAKKWAKQKASRVERQNNKRYMSSILQEA